MKLLVVYVLFFPSFLTDLEKKLFYKYNMNTTKNYSVTEKCKVGEETLFCSPSLTWYLISKDHTSQDMRDKLVGSR